MANFVLATNLGCANSMWVFHGNYPVKLPILGYKLEITLQLKCIGTVAEKQAKLYLKAL
jgi:hypothetical protein